MLTRNPGTTPIALSLLFALIPATAFASVTGISNPQPNPIVIGRDTTFTVDVDAFISSLPWDSTDIYIINESYSECVNQPSPGYGQGAGDVMATIEAPVLPPLDTPGTYDVSAEDFAGLDCGETGSSAEVSVAITVITQATFTVTKDFLDDSGLASASVQLVCDDGTVAPNSPQALGDNDQAVFTVSEFAIGSTQCQVQETAGADGYTVTYEGQCSADPVVSGTEYDCTVVNTPTRATFAVDKVFTDGNPGEVEVSISCNTGLPLEQSKLITAAEGVTFVVTEFDQGELDCVVTETEVAGYDAEYFDGTTTNDTGCEYLDVTGGPDNVCTITNTPAPVDIEITKDWVFEGSSDPEGIDQYYELTLWCDAEIVDGFHLVPGVEAPTGETGTGCGLIMVKSQDGPQEIIELADWCKGFSGNGPDTFNAQVIPEYPDSNCYVVENVFDNAAEVDNGCQSLTVSAGQGALCTITNTVFFEGIPTLNTYGKLLLALLMLGVGFVAFRRLA